MGVRVGLAWNCLFWLNNLLPHNIKFHEKEQIRSHVMATDCASKKSVLICFRTMTGNIKIHPSIDKEDTVLMIIPTVITQTHTISTVIRVISTTNIILITIHTTINLINA